MLAGKWYDLRPTWSNQNIFLFPLGKKNCSLFINLSEHQCFASLFHFPPSKNQIILMVFHFPLKIGNPHYAVFWVLRLRKESHGHKNRATPSHSHSLPHFKLKLKPKPPTPTTRKQQQQWRNTPWWCPCTFRSGTYTTWLQAKFIVELHCVLDSFHSGWCGGAAVGSSGLWQRQESDKRFWNWHCCISDMSCCCVLDLHLS